MEEKKILCIPHTHRELRLNSCYEEQLELLDYQSGGRLKKIDCVTDSAVPSCDCRLLEQNECIHQVHILAPCQLDALLVIQQANSGYVLEYGIRIRLLPGENIIRWCKYDLHSRLTGGLEASLHLSTPEKVNIEVIHPLYNPTETEHPNKTRISNTCVQHKYTLPPKYPFKLRLKTHSRGVQTLFSLAMWNLEGPDLMDTLHKVELKVKPNILRMKMAESQIVNAKIQE